MLTVIKRVLIFLCIIGLTNPFLYAQGEAIAPTIIPLPEKTTLNNVILPAIVIHVPAIITPAPEKELLINADYINISLPAPLITESQFKQNAVFFGHHQKKNQAFFDFVDQKVSENTLQKQDDKKMIRQEWQSYLGIDIWYPYFKTKEIEEWLCDRTKVEILHFKGRVKFESNQIKYTFKMRF